MLRGHPNLYRSDGLVDLVNRFLPVNNLSELSTQFEACTVNIDDARLDFHSVGDPRKVLVASASASWRVQARGDQRQPACRRRDRLDASRSSGPRSRRDDDLRLRLPGRYPHQLPAEMSALGVLTSSIAVTREILTPSHDHLNVIRLPAPDIQGIGLFDFSQGSRLIAEGHDLVAAFLAEQPQVTALQTSSAA